MSIKSEIFSPRDVAGWNDLILGSPGYSFFHSSNWTRVLSESYHYRPCYFTSTPKEPWLSFVPIMEIRSFLTGRRGVSLPFTDHCEIMVREKSHFDALITSLTRYGREARWRYVEWRGGKEYFEDVAASTYYYSHTLDLLKEEDQIFSGLRNSTRRNIKKAVKEGVQVKISRTLDAVKDFYRLNCMTRKHHGLPPQPFEFFKKVHEHVIDKDMGFVVLALYGGDIIASAVFFHLAEKTIYKYGASDKAYQYLRPNNLVMWDAIKWCIQNGMKQFNFGRTDPGNQGLLQFKQGWGAKKEVVNYYKYDLRADCFVQENARMDFLNRLFHKMPTSLLSLIGSLLYRHVG